jgi:hypothetical protein
MKEQNYIKESKSRNERSLIKGLKPERLKMRKMKKGTRKKSNYISTRKMEILFTGREGKKRPLCCRYIYIV